LKEKLELDYLYFVEDNKKVDVKSEIAKEAFNGQAKDGTRVIRKEELLQMGEELYKKSEIEIRPTPKARPTETKILDSAMALECAIPVFNKERNVVGVVYGGKVLNRDFTLIDKIHDFVFENKLYDGKPIGTVTIFEEDVRIATNVLDKESKRAIGTRVSETVYKNVFLKGSKWIDRAFVVTDWYLTAYEPIYDIYGKIIGMLYVGILEKPFVDLQRSVLFALFGIIFLAIITAAILSYIFAESVVRPVRGLLLATQKLSWGDLQHKIDSQCSIREFDELADSFNKMADVLHERDKSLKISNEKLAALNKSYLDMVGFVSHELKGMLGSIVMNIYTLKDGYLGGLNEKQKKAVDATARSLDYFESVVKNYLDLSRIEKGELELKITEVDINKDIFESVIGYFEKQSQAKKMRIENIIKNNIKVYADKNLLGIVCNNLLGNAFKYSIDGGRLVITAKEDNGIVQVGIYNDGKPIKETEKDMLFRKFSRLSGSENVKGTGLGLFIVKEIINKHGGQVWVEPKENGNEFIFSLRKADKKG
jgi:two-component system NtrC family sensor kinase